MDGLRPKKVKCAELPEDLLVFTKLRGEESSAIEK